MLTVYFQLLHGEANRLANRLIDSLPSIGFPEAYMHALSTAASRTTITPRRSERHPLVLPARVTWKDARGALRFASVVTRDVSEDGIFIEWTEASTIPLYRLVTLQLERDARNIDGVPQALRTGKVLSAVYRAGDFQKSTDSGRIRPAPPRRARHAGTRGSLRPRRGHRVSSQMAA